jgi:dolichyl-phosphate beta-glucosyltransferase
VANGPYKHNDEYMILSVIIPFFNEAERLPKNLPIIVSYLNKNYKDNYEILLVDDGSKDNTKEKLEEFIKLSNIHLYIHYQNRGKGAAVRTGIMESLGDYVFFTDSDLSTPIEDLKNLVPFIKETKYQVAIGSRALDDSNIQKEQPLSRRIIGKLGNILIRIILGLKIKDTQCGFKLFKKEVAYELFKDLKMHRWSFDFQS